MSLPYSYSLEGTVQLLDIDGNVASQDIDIYIGGYKTTAASGGAFFIRFSASTTNKIPIVFSYVTSSGDHVTHVEYIALTNGEYTLQREYILYG